MDVLWSVIEKYVPELKLAVGTMLEALDVDES